MFHVCCVELLEVPYQELCCRPCYWIFEFLSSWCFVFKPSCFQGQTCPLKSGDLERLQMEVDHASSLARQSEAEAQRLQYQHENQQAWAVMLRAQELWARAEKVQYNQNE